MKRAQNQNQNQKRLPATSKKTTAQTSPQTSPQTSAQASAPKMTQLIAKSLRLRVGQSSGLVLRAASVFAIASPISAILALSVFLNPGIAHAATVQSSSSIKNFQFAKSKIARDAIELKSIRRVGVGAQVGGASGLGGVSLEMNFRPTWSVMAGYGGGDGFRSFSFHYKRLLGSGLASFASGSLLPYWSMGFSQWSSPGMAAAGTRSLEERKGILPPLLQKKASLRASGELFASPFVLNIAHPALGLQLLQPTGPFAGASVSIEAVLLAELGDFVVSPAGALGVQYFF